MYENEQDMLKDYSIYTNADMVLTEQILVFTKILKSIDKDKNKKKYEMMDKLVKSMHHALNFINDTSKVHQMLSITNQENKLLKRRLSIIENELTKYKVVEELILTGELENVKQAAQQAISKSKDGSERI